MIPRLPPLLLAALGGASIYGIKAVLDKLEQKQIGPPGSSEHAERKIQFRKTTGRIGMAMAAAGLIYAGFWVYNERVTRPTPSSAAAGSRDRFYEDQYSDRDERLRDDIKKINDEQHNREDKVRQRLLESMKNAKESSGDNK
ncbi:hypothetical protein DFQ28_008399 [Apophysomyces sp. BC1034]|nr:hypothetical protein DFQ30_007933 [Apophysomyces sp. BC1015]KAG0181876.1 hypothetical protein DFQ29_006670 [Apophysomyces sp. BC1021]KAG0192650.1 hypothetical protein DFQ28_008399 [Apophysomyces sp. BC1034]